MSMPSLSAAWMVSLLVHYTDGHPAFSPMAQIGSDTGSGSKWDPTPFRLHFAWVAENEWNPGTFEYRIERLDIYDGRWAIIDGTGIAETYSYKYSNVLIKEDGRWQAVASHVPGYEER